MIFFKTITYTLFASVLFAACTESVGMPESGGGEKATLRVALSFDGTGANTKAGSTAIPKTSWGNIHSLQFFLLSKPDNKVVYSHAIIPTVGNQTIYDGRELVLTGIPVGPYKLVVLGNANTSKDLYGMSFRTSINGGITYNTPWDSWNVRGKNAETDLLISYPEAYSITHPISGITALAVPNGLIEHFSPYTPDFFKGTADVDITAGENRIVSPIPFTRMESLMRARLNLQKYAADFKTIPPSISDGNMRKFVWLFRVPKDMNMITGSNPMTLKDNEAFHLGRLYNNDFWGKKLISDYNPEGTILDAEFTHGGDFIVYPNNTGDSVEADRRYFIVLGMSVRKGHVLANGEKTKGLERFDAYPSPGKLPVIMLNQIDKVYWSAMINAPFKANEIREVNMTLVTGGSLEFPKPTDDSSMNITISKPQPWTVTDIPYVLN